MGGQTASSRDAHMRELIAQYLPKAKRGERTTPLLIADTGAPRHSVAEASPGADSRLPRSRPELEDKTGARLRRRGAPHDVVAEAMAAADVERTPPRRRPMSDDAQGDIGEEPEDDPIAHRIQVASSVAEFADIALEGTASDPIARLTELARIRVGVKDIVAAPRENDDAVAAETSAEGLRRRWLEHPDRRRCRRLRARTT